MTTTGIEIAEAWLEGSGYKVIWERGGFAVAGKSEQKPEEIACLVVDQESLRSGAALERLKKLLAWKALTAGRWIALLVHRDIANDELLVLHEADQIVRYPREQYYPDQRPQP